MFKMVNYRKGASRMRILRPMNGLMFFVVLAVGACFDSGLEFSRDLGKIGDLNYGTRDTLVSDVSNLVSRISEEPSASNRDAMLDSLISKVVVIEFSPPRRDNTPVESMASYAEFLKGVARIVKDKIPPEKTFDMLLRGLKRFDLAISHVDEWTHQCFPSPEDWGLPPETEEVLACLKSGDTNGAHASPLAQKMLRSISPDLKNRLPGIVERVMDPKRGGGARALNYRGGIEDEKMRFAQTISSEFMYAWALELAPKSYEALRRRFREETGCDLPANGGRISFRTNINCRVAK